MFCCEVVDINFDDISTASAYIHTDINRYYYYNNYSNYNIWYIYMWVCVCVCASIYTYTINYYHILMDKRTNQSNSGVVMICDSALEKETCIFRWKKELNQACCSFSCNGWIAGSAVPRSHACSFYVHSLGATWRYTETTRNHTAQ